MSHRSWAHAYAFTGMDERDRKGFYRPDLRAELLQSLELLAHCEDLAWSSRAVTSTQSEPSRPVWPFCVHWRHTHRVRMISESKRTSVLRQRWLVGEVDQMGAFTRAPVEKFFDKLGMLSRYGFVQQVS